MMTLSSVARAETIYFLTWDVESGDKKNYICNTGSLIRAVSRPPMRGP